MTSQIIPRSQKVEVTEAEKVQVTETVEDGGTFVRAIRVYGSPDGTDGPPVLEIILRADSAEKIAVTTPELSF